MTGVRGASVLQEGLRNKDLTCIDAEPFNPAIIVELECAAGKGWLMSRRCVPT